MNNLKKVYQVTVSDQRLAMQQIPRLASGAVNSVGLAFTGLDAGNWAGLTYTAVFWRNEKEVHHVLTREGLAGQSDELKVWIAVVPAEVMAEEGAFWLGLMGTGEDFTITSEAIRLNVFQGAITTPTNAPAEPTPDVYTQLLEGYAVTQARVSSLVAMKGTGGETVITMSGDDYVKDGIIKVSGANASIAFLIDGLTLNGYSMHETDGCIPPELMPLFPHEHESEVHSLIQIKVENPDISVYLCSPLNKNDWASIRIFNETANDIGVYGAYCHDTYPLASVTVSEVVDARVDRNGKVWPTLGDHARHIVVEQTSLLGNALKGHAEGAPVVVTDASPLEHDLKIKIGGYTAEDLESEGLDISTAKVIKSGKNLLTYPYIDTSIERHGVKWTDNGDGSITIEGTPTAAYTAGFVLSKDASLFKDGYTYTLSAGNVLDCYIQYNDESGTAFFVRNVTWKHGYTLTGIYLQAAKIQEYNGTAYPQLEIGAAATEWEPYREPVEKTANKDGSVEGFTCTGEGFTLELDATTDLDLRLEVDYNRDINKAIARLEAALMAAAMPAAMPAGGEPDA